MIEINTQKTPLSSVNEVKGTPYADSETDRPQTLIQIITNAHSAIKIHTPPSYWVKADIANVNASDKGYYNIELVEYDDKNRLIAKIRSFIHAKKVKYIVGRFESETGSKLKKNISVLVKIDISISPVFGIQSNILAIDPSFTMGAAQIKKNNIIKRLRAENIYSKNRDLKIPAFIRKVAVISPQSSAAIGDFRTEADILEANSLCEFEYIPAIFQGPNAVSSLVSAFSRISEDVDCVVFIRGGGK